MGRPRSYDPDDVLDRALRVFWKHGYQGTSIADLTEATGVNRFGLYQTWGDKRGLYVACLDRYAANIGQPTVQAALDEGPALEAIRAYFRLLAEHVLADEEALSCFVLASVMEIGARDPELHQRLRGYLDNAQHAFAETLRRGVAAGELRADVDVAAHAAHLAVCAQAVLLQARTQPDPAVVQHFVAVSLAPLAALEA